MPNTTDNYGNFDIYQDGELVEHTNISWVPSSLQGIMPLTAFYDGNTLKLANVQTGTDEQGNPVYGAIDIVIGNMVGSLNFIPSVMSSVVSYPTTDSEFFHITNYISESKFNSSTFKFATQTNLNKSNTVDFEYRVNPSGAFVYEYAQAEFLNRSVTSRAADDSKNLLNVVTTPVISEGGKTENKYFTNNNGELTVRATLNGSRLSSNKADIVAFQLKNGQTNWTTSDYVAISSTKINATLVDSVATKTAKKAVEFYNRDQAITSSHPENDAFIKQFVTLADAANVTMLYDGTLDLKKLPGLYSTEKATFIKDLGFTGMSYKFSLPATYQSNDAQKTNQQWFVTLSNDGVLSANKTNLTDGLTPAVGRTPVVRVDAYLTDNAGASYMVASAYIKVSIVAEEPSTEEKGNVNVVLADKEVNYANLTGNMTETGKLGWQEINNQIYGANGLTSTSFWNWYSRYYDIKVTSTDDKDKQVTVFEQKGIAYNNTYTREVDGINFNVVLGSGDTQTALVQFGVYNKILTQQSESRKDVGNKGAEYVITLTIPSTDKTKYGDVVVSQKVYVKETCSEFKFNPNYYNDALSAVVTKGKIVNGAWVLEMNVSEVFEMINGKNVFAYYNQVNKNATNIEFSLVAKPAQTGVAYDANTGALALNAPLTATSKTAHMQYVITLVNGEKCAPQLFDVIFNNPFAAGNGKAISLKGNARTVQTAQAAPSVLVTENGNNDAIYSWNAKANALIVSDLAKSGYKLTDADVSVTYAFDTNDAEYKAFTSQLDKLNQPGGSTFKIDSNTGVITWENLGSDLVKSFTFPVKATVTIGTLSKVTCTFDFTINTDK